MDASAGGGGGCRVSAERDGISFHGNENGLNLLVPMAAKLCDYTKNH